MMSLVDKIYNILERLANDWTDGDQHFIDPITRRITVRFRKDDEIDLSLLAVALAQGLEDFNGQDGNDRVDQPDSH